MARRFALLVAAAGICAAVVVAVWLRGEGDRTSDALTATRPAIDWELEPPDVYTDPDAAVATILELRSEFGSVLTNSELDVPGPNGGGAAFVSGPQSFDDFVRAAAGVTAPPASETETESSDVDGMPPAADGELAQSLREAATLLGRRAERAEESGDIARQQRFLGLATLLRAEADALAENQADR